MRARRGPGPALRELIAAFRSLESPTVLVLDDVHMLRSKGSADVVAALALDVPNGSAVVLAGRSAARAPLARVRAHGGLLEVGAEELAFSRRDSKRLLRGLGVELEPAEVDDLLRVTEGWPVGVYLAGLALRDGKPGGAVPGGDDRFVTDYLDLEILSRLGSDDVSFLIRTSVLDELCGPLCDAVLDQEGSGRKLEALSRAGLFVVPLDRRREAYRYQRAFRDFLRAELERREPDAAAGLFSRASAWCEEHGRAEEAVAYAHAAGETDRVAELVGRHALAAWARGQPRGRGDMARLVRRVLRPRGSPGDRRSGGLGARRRGPAVGVGAVACRRGACDAPPSTSRRERLDRAMARGRARRALCPGARTHAGGRRPRT